MSNTFHSPRWRDTMRRRPRPLRLVFILSLLTLLLGGMPARAADPAAAGTLTLDISGPPKLGSYLPGETLTLAIALGHVGGTTPIEAELRDSLPDGLAVDGAPSLEESSLGAVNPRDVAVDRGANTVSWSGQIAPDGQLTLRVPVRVESCFGDDRIVENLAEARPVGGSTISAEWPVSVDCRGISIAQVSVQQSLVRAAVDLDSVEAQAAPGDDPAVVPGHATTIRATVRNNGAEPVALSLNVEPITFEPRPAASQLAAEERRGLDIRALRLGPGEAYTFDRPVLRMEVEFTDELRIDPADVFLVSAITYCLADGPVVCPDPATRPHIAARHVFRIPIRRSDLGDAPDSSNHFAAPMTAYPGVGATFPTVFDPGTGLPQGPRHRHPRPFHLGQRVSLEFEADVGPDQEPINNLVPPANNPDNDRFDDGIRPHNLSFAHCRATTFQAGVFIHPAFQAAALQSGLTRAYLNVWVDGRRDGDWNDAAQCPVVEGQPSVALEHIVIDQPVNIAALQAGMNIIPVATQRVLWPDELKARPAWLRVTLSERPANKTLQAGDIRYGDGRGYAEPFRTGETEDYLINRGDTGADVSISKSARVDRLDLAHPENGRIAWVIEYQNRGDRPAREVVIRDQFDGGLSIIAVLIGVTSRPELPYRRDGDSLVFDVGNVEPGAGGRIVIVTSAPHSPPPILRNVATVRAANDGNLANNQASAEVRLGLPAPVITGPGNGTTSFTRVTFSGRSVPGSSVSLFDHGASLDATSVADAQGRWVVEVDLTAGRHSITAQATLGGRQSRFSQPMFLIVDPTLPYSPLSMRFADPRGHRHRPVDEHGRTDDGGWRVRLKVDTTYQFGVQSNCAEPDAQFQLQIDGLPAVALGDVNGDGIYTGSFTTGDARISARFALVIFCGGVRYISGGTMLWDPEGVVSDAANGQPLAGATVTLLEQTEGGLRPWPAEEYGQSNPQTTGTDGRYSFYTPPGVYVVEVRRAGYQTYRTEELVVVDGPAHRDIALTAEAVGQLTYMLAIDDSGFDSPVLRVRPGAIVEVLNVDVWEHAIISPRDPASGQATGRHSSGLLGAGERHRVTIPVLDGTSKETGYFLLQDSANGFSLAAIVVDPSAPPPGGYRVFLPLLLR